MTGKAIGATAPWSRRVVPAAAALVAAGVGWAAGWLGALVALLALFGAPLFAIMGGTAELAWLTHSDSSLRHLRFLAPTVLDERFAGSPILVTIPLFTFVGYVMAESKAPDRMVRASTAVLGWLPGGLAMVCIFASAFFTTLTGGSGVTIIAIGALLYPALRKQGYPENFSLGLVTTGGSLGLLFPPSLPILVYALVAGLDFTAAFKAGLVPGTLIMILLGIYAAVIGVRSKVPRVGLNFVEVARSLWLVKWEALIPIIILGGLSTGLTSLEESAAITALYVIAVEMFVYKDLSLRRDLPRVAKSSMSLAGAVILILAMANSLINYVIDQQIPGLVLEGMLSLGLSEPWQFLIILNVFLLVLGMLMDGFSAILVAVPLILPFAARFNLQPFHLAMMFILNLEIAYCAPPLGLNLFISSFRFSKPVLALYRVVLPFVAVLTLGLVMVVVFPRLSTLLIEPDIREARARALREGVAPAEAWRLECVQEDSTHPQPCTDEERARYLPGPSVDGGSTDTEDDALMREMMGEGGADDSSADDSTADGGTP